MNYVFFGTPEFAAIILKKLIDAGMPPAAVVCNPDRPAGRRKVVTPPPVKVLAQGSGIEVWQPEKFDMDLQGKLARLKPNFATVAAYAKIIPKEVIAVFPRGMLGAHPSLLPKYRGSSPIQAALLAGDKKTGATIYLLDEKTDHGPVLAQKELEFPVSGLRFPDLLPKLAGLCGDLLIETVSKFLRGEIEPKPQDEAKATYTKKFSGEDAFVAPEILQMASSGADAETAAVIERKIRALNPEPGVWTVNEPASGTLPAKTGARVKLLQAEIQNGKLVLKKIQEEGGLPKDM